jgi:hypothetical protein
MPPGIDHAAEARDHRSSFHRALGVSFARVPELDKRGMSAEVRRAARAAGIPLEEPHPFDYRHTATVPIAELSTLPEFGKDRRGRRRSVR